MKDYPGVSKCRVNHQLKLGHYKNWKIAYIYYKARIMVEGRSIFLGYFQTPEEAAAAYQAAKQNIRTAAAFFVLWLGVSYVFSLVLFPFWFAASFVTR